MRLANDIANKADQFILGLIETAIPKPLKDSSADDPEVLRITRKEIYRLVIRNLENRVGMFDCTLGG